MPPLRIAHRGLPRQAPENTLSSFQLALEAGADGLELDVHATRDRVVVIHHDPQLADGTVISAVTFDVLRSMEVAPGVRVPALGELCQLVDGRAELFVEVKGAAIEEEVLEVMGRYRGAFAIHSFDHALIARIHRRAPQVRLGVLFEDAVPDLPTLLETTGATDVWPHEPLVSRPLVASAHALGARVIPWTVNTPDEVSRLDAAGVDGLCGDDVRIFPRA